MTLFIISCAVLLALSQAEVAAADAGSRALRGRSKGGTYAARIQQYVCPYIECDGVDVDELNCAFEKPAGFMADMEERSRKIGECACCAGASVEDVPGGDGPPGSSGDGSGEDASADVSGDDSDAEAADAGPRALRGRSKGGTYAARIQQYVCPYIECDGVDVDELDCAFEKPAGFMADMEERSRKIGECACCADTSVKVVPGGDGPPSSSGDSPDEDNSGVDGSGDSGVRK